MAAIKSLLNPLAEAADQDNNSMDSKDDSSTVNSDAGFGSDVPGDSVGKQSRKKQKISKDAAIFKPGPIRGECRYPPREDHDEFTATQHEALNVYPVGGIATYARHIPYNSEKKLFLDKTGREYFEVFQYTFRIPSESVTYTMIWDYNIGLVRTTPLFKCGQYSKTTPAKMLARNQGLKDICHSITGGALVAQGYWIPFEAAKAVAATFCWNIRYALTPVFGKDFPATCLHPDSEGYGSMHIDPDITKRCAEQARMYRELEPLQDVSMSMNLNSNNNHSPPLMSATTGGGSPQAQAHAASTTPRFKRQFKKLMPKPLQISSSGFASDVSSTGASQEEEDDEDDVDDDDDKYVLSSPSSHAGGGGSGGLAQPWSAINSPLRSPSPKIKFRNPWTHSHSHSNSNSRSHPYHAHAHALAHSPASSTRSDSPNGGGSRRKRHRAARVIPRSYAPLDTLPPPYKPLYPGVVVTEGLSSVMGTASANQKQRGMQREFDNDGGGESEPLIYHHHHQRMDLDEDYDAGSDDSDSPMGLGLNVPGEATGLSGGHDKGGNHSRAARKKSAKAFTDFNAALVLMQMREVSKNKGKHGDLTTGLRRLKRPASL